MNKTAYGLRLLAVVGLAMAAGASSCCRKPRVKPPVIIQTAERDCTEDLPASPGEPPTVWQECDDWETCLTGEGADRLGAWIEKVLARDRAVKTECGKIAEETDQ